MEGQTKPTDKLKYIESKKKINVGNKITQSHIKLITAANNHNILLIGCEDNSIKYIETDQLFDFTSNQSQVIQQPATLLATLTFRPTLLAVSRYGYSEILLVAGVNAYPKHPVIQVFDLDTRSSIGQIYLSDLGDTEIVDYAWHPNYYKSLVTLCTSRGHLLVLAISKQNKGIGIIYKNEQYGALTCCWSMKGKNLAIGTQRGQIVRLEPVVGDNSISFKEVNGSYITFTNPKVTADHQLVRLRWINSKYLIATHVRPNLNNPDTVYSLTTVKPARPYLYWTNIQIESQFGSSYAVHIANLSNGIICMSSATGEAATIGVLGASQAVTNELNDWGSLIIEDEGARIELPLDENNAETHPCGLTLTTWPQDGRPILIAYTNSGLVCSYAVVHTDNILKLPEHLNQPEQQFAYNPISQTSRPTLPSMIPNDTLGPSLTASTLNTTTSLFGMSAAPKFGEVASFSSTGLTSSIPTPITNAPTSLFGMSTGPKFGEVASFSSTGLTSSVPDSMPNAPTSLFGMSMGPKLGEAASFSSTGLTSGVPAPMPNAPTSLFGMSTGPKLGEVASFSSTGLTSSVPAPKPNAPTSLFGMSTGPKLGEAASFSSIGLTSSATAPTESAQPSLFGMSTVPKLGEAAKSSSISRTSSVAATTNKAQSSFSWSPTPAPPSLSTAAKPTLPSIVPAATPAQSSASITATMTSNAPSCPTSISINDGLESELNAINDLIQSVRKKLDFNGAYISLFEELNHLRDQFDQTLDLHKAHHEALQVVKDDIDHLDLDVLETFYLIEYVKSRISCDIKKKSIDPITAKKVNNIKMKLKQIGTKLEELNDHVDVAWEDFVRRRSAKERHTISLDAIYKALTTNQKIINVLRRKVSIEPEKQPPVSDAAVNNVKRIAANVKRIEEQDLSRFEEFLASRSVVPVRQPVHLTQ